MMVSIVGEDDNIVLTVNSNGTEAIIIPPAIYIMNNENKYLTRIGADGLQFSKTIPDVYCKFVVTKRGADEFKLTSDAGNSVALDDANGFAVWLGRNLSTTYFRLTALTPQPTKLYVIGHILGESSQKTLTGSNYNAGSVSTTNTATPTNQLLVTDLAPRTISDVNYDFDHANAGNDQPLVALSTFVRNDSATATITQALNYTYEKCTVGTWNNTLGWEIGITVSPCLSIRTVV
jgi:hypothetical protein